MKTKKFEEFINVKIGLDLVKNENKTNDINEYEYINESKSPEELKKVAEKIGLDLTKNLSKRIDLIYI